MSKPLGKWSANKPCHGKKEKKKNRSSPANNAHCYEKRGNLPAFALVRPHFKVMQTVGAFTTCAARFERQNSWIQWREEPLLSSLREPGCRCPTRQGKWSTLAPFLFFVLCSLRRVAEQSAVKPQPRPSTAFLANACVIRCNTNETATLLYFCDPSVKKKVGTCWHDSRRHWRNPKSPWSCCSARWKATTFRLDEE